MIGTLFNCIMILAGSTIGSLFKKGIKDEYQEALMQAMGLAAMALGINAIVQYLPSSNYPVLFIVSLAIGGLVGQKLNFDRRFNEIVNKFSKGNLAEGLSTAILLFCIGSLSILGPVEAALKGNYTYLITNGILDGITSIVLASTFGFGISAAAIVLFLWQGFFYVGAKFIENFLTADLLAEISIVGGVLILSTGLSILGIKKFKTLNLLPALLLPFIVFLFINIFNL
ncbi:DUF554 domain-containing protein [Bacillus massiliigorillae]|uniref:DUF554 domain-containing protein n=1 Tax=Bacillus massiliigorillae TaxID=1243664 RepID=UPI0003A26C9A|nr:DUF554 domain-containing protein [Bacillus massiliigorillae]